MQAKPRRPARPANAAPRSSPRSVPPAGTRPCSVDRGSAGPSSASTSPTPRLSARRRRSSTSAPPPSGSGARSRCSASRRGRSCGSLRGDFAELETGMHVTLTPREIEGDRETIPVSWAGITDLRQGQHVHLADGAIRLRVDDPDDGEVDRDRRRHRLLAQGDEHPGRGAVAGDDRDRPRLGRVRGRARGRPAAVSFVSSADDLAPVEAAAARARLDDPADRQDREVDEGTPTRGDRPRRDRRRSWSPAATSERGRRRRRMPMRAEAAIWPPPARPEAGDHRRPRCWTRW